jgi:hypothetical protein
VICPRRPPTTFGAPPISTLTLRSPVGSRAAAEIADLHPRRARERVAVDPARLQEDANASPPRGLQRNGATDAEVVASGPRAQRGRVAQTADERLHDQTGGEEATRSRDLAEAVTATVARSPRSVLRLTAHLTASACRRRIELQVEATEPGRWADQVIAVRGGGDSRPRLAKAASEASCTGDARVPHVLADLDDVPTLVFDDRRDR